MRIFFIILFSLLSFSNSEIYLESINSDDHPIIKAKLYLTDNNNNIIDNISSSTFVVFEPPLLIDQEFIESVKLEDNIYSGDITICIEMSSSIDESKTEMIFSIIEEILRYKNEDQNIRIIGFNDRSYHIQNLSSDPVLDEIKNLYYPSGTANIDQLFDNSHNGLFQLDLSGSSKILIISDGELSLNDQIIQEINNRELLVYNAVLNSNISSSLLRSSENSKYFENINPNNIDLNSKIITYNLLGYSGIELSWISNNCDQTVQGNIVHQLPKNDNSNADFVYISDEKISSLEFEENETKIASFSAGTKSQFTINFEYNKRSKLEQISYDESVLTLINAPEFDSLDPGTEYALEFEYTHSGDPYSYELISINTNSCIRDVFYLTIGNKSQASETENITILSPTKNSVYFPESEIDVRWIGTNPLDSFRVSVKSLATNNSTLLKENINGNRTSVVLPKSIGEYKLEIEHLSEAHNIRNVNSLGVEKGDPRLVSFNEDSRLLAIYNRDNSVEVWDRNDSRREKVIANSVNGLNDFAWSPVSDKLALTSSDGNRVLIYDLNEDEPQVLSGSLSEVNNIEWKLDEQQLVGGNVNGELLIWTFNESAVILDVFKNIEHNGEPISSIEQVAWHPNGNLIFFLDENGKLMVYNFEILDFQFIQDLGNGNNFFKISPSGDSLFIAGSNSSIGYSLLELDLSQDEINTSLLSGSNLVKNFEYINWSPSSNRIAYNSGNTIRTFDIEEGKRSADFNLHQQTLNGLDINGDFVVSYDQSEDIKIWNINLQNLRKVFDRKESEEFSIINLIIDLEDINLNNVCRNYSNFVQIDQAIGNSSFIKVQIDSVKISDNLKEQVFIENISLLELNRNQYADISFRVESSSEDNLSGEVIYYIDGKEFRQDLSVNFLETDYTIQVDETVQIQLDPDMVLREDLFQNTSNDNILIDSVYVYLNQELIKFTDQEFIGPGDFFKINLPLDQINIGNYEARFIMFAFSSCTPIDIGINYQIIAPDIESADSLFIVECANSNTFSYPIKNSGNGDLDINNIISNSQQLAVIEFDDLISAGETGEVIFEINSESGTFSGSIDLETNILNGLVSSYQIEIGWVSSASDFILSEEQIIFNESEQTKELIVTNNGDFSLNLDDSFLSTFTLDPAILTISARSSITFNIISGNEDNIEENLVINGKCSSNTITLLSRFDEMIPILSTIDNLNFGQLQCENNSTDFTILIQNTGNADLIIDNIYLANASIFSIESDHENPIVPNDQFNIRVNFENPTEFNNYDTLIIEYNNINTRKVPIEAQYLRSSFTTDKNLIEFRDIPSNERFTEKITISNLGNQTATVDLFLDDPHFELSENPLIIEAGGSKELDITFIGGQPDDFINTFLDFTDDCSNSYSIPINLNVIGNKYFTFEAQGIIGNPRETVSLNYVITNPNELELPENSSFSATISFNKTMLTPLDVAFKQSHLLTHYEIDADLKDILNTSMNLDLLVSLGNDTITNIDFEARFTDNNGFYFRSFTSQFAYQDDYLQNNPGPIFGSGINLKGPNPNPVFDKFEITFNMIENTNCKAQIIDASGRVLFTLIDQVLKQGPHTYSFDAIKLSNGMYYLNFNTGNYQSIKPFIIFR